MFGFTQPISGIAIKGNGALGWLFGLKSHIVIDGKGVVLNFVVAQGNIDDRRPL